MIKNDVIEKLIALDIQDVVADYVELHGYLSVP